jgi:hypothetical protein
LTEPGRDALGLQGKYLEAAGLREKVMSQENVETVRETYEPMARGDFSVFGEVVGRTF